MNIFYDANLIYEAGTKAVKSASFKHKSQLFEMNQLLETAQIQQAMISKTYEPVMGTKFTLNERGKVRDIVTNTMIDKTVNHLLCDNVLTPYISNYLIYDNSASQVGKGVHFHRKRLETHLHKYYREHKSNQGYILLMDFSGYYASIPHKKCLEVIYKHLRNMDNEEKAITMWILQNLFYLFSEENKQSKGVDIGSQPSQNVGIAYPYRIDNYIKIMRQCKYYGRYTDDSYIIHENKDFLKEILKEVIKIADSFGLKINPKKTQIKKLSETFKILQIKYYLTDTGKVVKRINSKTITRERRKLKAYKRLLNKKVLTIEEIENIFKSWMACNYKNMSMQQIANMSQLYYDLFRRKVKWKKGHGKLRYLMEQQLKI